MIVKKRMIEIEIENNRYRRYTSYSPELKVYVAWFRIKESATPFHTEEEVMLFDKLEKLMEKMYQQFLRKQKLERIVK